MQPPTPPKRILISYDDNNEDKRWAEWIRGSLKMAGYVVEEGPRPGNIKVLAWEEAFNNSDHVIAVLSPDYLKVWKQHPEVINALDQNTSGEQSKLLPVLVRECKNELKGVPSLSKFQPINLIGVSDALIARSRLLAGVDGRNDQSDESPIFPPSGMPDYPGDTSLDELTDPKFIQQREDTVKKIYDRLVQPGLTALALVGMSGVGLTTLAALVYNYAETQRKNDGELRGKTIWISIAQPNISLNQPDTFLKLAERIFNDLGQSMPPSFKDLPPLDQASALTNALRTVQEPRLIILDRFENFLDEKTGQALLDQPGVGEWIDRLNKTLCACRVLLTSHISPKGTEVPSHDYLQEYREQGLDEKEGIEFLRMKEARGTKKDFQDAVGFCEGHAMALKLLVLFANDNKQSIAKFLNDSGYTNLLHKDIARRFLHPIYEKRLNDGQRELLRGFAIYREPVPIEAALAIEGNTTRTQQVENMNAPLMKHLAPPVSDTGYQLHPIVRAYVQNNFVSDDNVEGNKSALAEAHKKAAQYYLQHPTMIHGHDKREKLDDMRLLIEAIWHHLQAELWRDAFNRMRRENIFSNLKDWGEYSILLGLCNLLLPVDKWNAEPEEEALIYDTLGEIYDSLWQKLEAEQHFERASQLYRVIGDESSEAKALMYLGKIYDDRGRLQYAHVYYQRALNIFLTKEDRIRSVKTRILLGDIYSRQKKYAEAQKCYEEALTFYLFEGEQLGQAEALSKLGDLYHRQGNGGKAKEHYQQAVHSRRSAEDQRGEAEVLNKLGELHNEEDDKDKAREYYITAYHLYEDVHDWRGMAESLDKLANVYLEQNNIENALKHCNEALRLYRQIGNRHDEALSLNSLGRIHDSNGQKQEASEYYLQALEILKDVGDRRIEGWVLYNIGVVKEALGAWSGLDGAEDFYNLALRVHREVKDRKAEGTTLTSIGQLFDKKGEKREAIKHFQKAIPIHREVRNRYQEGVALHDLGVVYSNLDYYDKGFACVWGTKQICDQISNTSDAQDLKIKVEKSLKAIQDRINKNTEGKKAYEKLLDQVRQPQILQQLIAKALTFEL